MQGCIPRMGERESWGIQGCVPVMVYERDNEGSLFLYNVHEMHLRKTGLHCSLVEY